MKSIKHALLLIAAFITTGTLLSGCATINESAELNPRVEAANAAFGPGFEYFIVKSDTNLSDAVFVGFFQALPGSELSRQLYNRIVTAESKGKRFMVTGDNAKKTAVVIIEALARSPDNGLPNLELLYLGSEQHAKGIEEAVRRVGGKMRFAPYPG